MLPKKQRMCTLLESDDDVDFGVVSEKKRFRKRIEVEDDEDEDVVRVSKRKKIVKDEEEILCPKKRRGYDVT